MHPSGNTHILRRHRIILQLRTPSLLRLLLLLSHQLLLLRCLLLCCLLLRRLLPLHQPIIVHGGLALRIERLELRALLLCHRGHEELHLGLVAGLLLLLDGAVAEQGGLLWGHSSLHLMW